MERVISIGERLQKLLEGAENDAESRVAEAQRKADDIISRARAEAENRRASAQRGRGIDELLSAEEERAKEEAAKIMEDYKKRADELKNVPENRFEEAVNLVLVEVLPR